MLIVQRKEINYILSIICFLIVVLLSGCSRITPPEERFTHSEDRGDGYDIYGGFDVRELEAQVEGYWKYFDNNEKEKELKMGFLNEWGGQWIQSGKYTVGRDIKQGLYICKDNDITSMGEVIVEAESKEGDKKVNYLFDDMTYVFLQEGNIVTFGDKTEMALADVFSLPQSNYDGIYYEGAYKVGEEIPEGEYFMLSVEVSAGTCLLTNEKNEVIGLVNRFGYVTIGEDLAVNLENCILIPLDLKPDIQPIMYQGEEEDKGKMVYAAGMYKIGEDIPVGNYSIKNEVYKNVTDLSYEGYHGNESYYYPGYWNWCGLIAYGDIGKEGWKEIELDSYLKSKERYLKVTDTQQKVYYQRYKGVPGITFSKKNAGNIVEIVRCVLIPQE
ncbi:hypothetical protein [Clostridium sp. KNHs205]|uniref:hypothetical protein n=1 Tax=Clostridium sp. KNHs205 TaxID=1449050 RepID=UPI00051ABECB|nr:hypothetical protein [Clostridium sp. KNHs205]